MKFFKYFKLRTKQEDNKISTTNVSNEIGEVNYDSKPNMNKKLVEMSTTENSKIKKEKLIKIIKELVLFIIILLSAIEYKRALKVPEQEEKDFDMDPDFFMDLIYKCLLSSVLTSIALFLIEFKICQIYQLILIIVIYLLFFITNTG